MKLKIFLLIGLLLPSSGSVAQDSALGGLLDMSLEQLLQVEVTGSTLTNESIRTVPAAVTVFTRAQIQRMGFDYLQELLNLVPGYQTQRNAEFPFIYAASSRGRRNGTTSKEILLLLDGRPMNGPRTGSTDDAVQLLPLEQIERVEVIRGPGSALYGSNAYTGVINIISRSGENEAGLAAGTHSMGKGHLLWSRQNGDWQLDLFAQAYTDQGQTYNVQDTFSPNRIDTSDPRRLVNLDLALRHAQTVLRTQYRRNEGEDFYSVGTLSNGFNNSRPTLSQISLEQDIDWRSGFRSHLYLGYLRTLVDFNTQLTAPGQLFAISAPASNEAALAIGTTEGESWQFKWHNNWQSSADGSMQFGMEWRRESETAASARSNFDFGQLAAGDFPVSYFGDFDQRIPFGTRDSRNLLGLYGQYQHSWKSTTHLTLGLRYDDYSRVGARLSPRFALVHELNDIHTVKLLYGEAFRAPAMNETGLINNPVIVGNPDLKYEVVKTWDLIWLGNWRDTSLSLGWFHNQYSDPIIAGLIGSTRTFINGPDEASQGLELEIHRQLTDHWLLGGSLTRFTQLPASASREADTMASLHTNFQQGAWNLNLAAVYHCDREMLTPGDIPLSLDDYWLVNGKLSYRAGSHWQTYLQVKNLLDEDYRTAPDGNTLTEGIPNRGREWSLGVEIQF